MSQKNPWEKPKKEIPVQTHLDLPFRTWIIIILFGCLFWYVVLNLIF